MRRASFSIRALLALAFLFGSSFAAAQAAGGSVRIVVVDENGQPVPEARIRVTEPGQQALELWTDYDGHCSFTPRQAEPYAVQSSKPGFYQETESAVDPAEPTLRVVLTHEQIVQEQVDVTASPPGIDTEQTVERSTMNTPEIVNIPYQTSRDIRYLLRFNPGVVQDASEQVHVAGSAYWETLDTIDGFNVRSPVRGSLTIRVSPDAVRTIDVQSTRYPVEYGRSTGGVIAFYTGMGDNRFRFNATNFVPSFRSLNGLRFDKFVPRFTFSGPIVRDRAWFYEGLEAEYDNIYIAELPENADTNSLTRGSNLLKAQVNLTPANILTAGLLVNESHSPYDGISSITPRESTVKRDTIAWLPYLRDKISFAGGALLDVGAGGMRVHDGYEPHGSTPYDLTPELPSGSYFENDAARSQRVEANAALYLPPRHWLGRHDVKMGFDADRVSDSENVARAPVSYLREDRTLLRRSTFPAFAPIELRNVEAGAYVQDRWQAGGGLLAEPGLRFDWDEIVRRPLFAPRLAAAYAPPSAHGNTKISAGAGLYYEHTQLEYLVRARAGIRSDTYYAADGVTPTGPAETTTFAADYGALQAPRALNWSLGVEQKLPGEVFARANFMAKRTTDLFAYANQNGSALWGNYLLTNRREDRYHAFEVDARRLFAGGHTIFLSYTRASARTNAALDYTPAVSVLGPQQSGPLPWDVPNRILTWGWLPAPLPRLAKSWDVVYTVDWHNGFPFTPVRANREVAGAAGAGRFPDFLDFSPGLEWKFHFRGAYFGLRGVLENSTGSSDPAQVYSVVDSPQYGTFSQPLGRAFTARLRLIGMK